MSPRWNKTNRPPRTRVFFATDVHGSERSFRKWLNAATVYEAQALILGGDLTGKAIVPLVRTSTGWKGELYGRPVEARGDDDLQEIRDHIRTLGFYDVLVSEEEAEALKSPEHREQVFNRVIRESVETWVELVEQRLAGKGVAVYMMLGNDDHSELAGLLRQSPIITYAEDQVTSLPGGYEMVSCGFSTPTPWHLEREVSEEELATMIDRQIDALVNPAFAIFNLHNPPYGTHLDQAPKLDEQLRPVVSSAGPEVQSVGSHTVRQAIERVQPMLALHGHIHESPGSERIGRTLCINPGSDYGQGILRGVLVDVDRERGIRSWQMVQG